MATETGPPSAEGRRITGSIAARIDRLPLTRSQYGLAVITQLFWGLMIANDAVVSRIYPFVWLPRHVITAFQFNVVLLANIGIGILIGEYAGGLLSDRFGRKRILIAGAVIDGVFLVPVGLTESFGWLLFWNLVFGVGIGMMLATNAVYLHEIAPPGSRQRLAQRTQIVATVSALLYPGLLGAVLLPAHEQLFVFILAGTVLVVLLPLGALLPESPRWLESKMRPEEADAIVSRWERAIERRTGPLPAPAEERHPVIAIEKVPVREIFAGQYRARTILLWACWFFGYSGMIYGAASFAPTYLALHGWSALQTFGLLGVLTAPAQVVAFGIASYLGERVERRSLILFAGVAFAVLSLLLLLTQARLAQAILFVVLNPLGVLWLFNMYNYTSVAYPTRLRSVGTGWTDGIGHLGSITAPLVAGGLFFATVGQNMYGWILWVALPGALLPGLLLGLLGMKQRAGILEELST